MNHITDVAMYEAMSEGQQKQAEMWVLGCQPNSVPRKAIHPLPYQPHSTHIAHVCLCDRKLLRDLERYLREMQTAPVSSVSVRGPSRLHPRSDAAWRGASSSARVPAPSPAHSFLSVPQALRVH